MGIVASKADLTLKSVRASEEERGRVETSALRGTVGNSEWRQCGLLWQDFLTLLWRLC